MCFFPMKKQVYCKIGEENTIAKLFVSLDIEDVQLN
jgi:hypothetical protein